MVKMHVVNWHLTYSNKYWINLTICKQVVEHILQLYRRKQIQKLVVNEDKYKIDLDFGLWIIGVCIFLKNLFLGKRFTSTYPSNYCTNQLHKSFN